MELEEFIQQLNLELLGLEVDRNTTEIGIYKRMPTNDRSNKRSKCIIFKFSDEFCEDIISDNFNMIKTKDKVEKCIHSCCKDYDFESNHERYECQPREKFTIDSNFIVYK